jgi:hypothetical protein
MVKLAPTYYRKLDLALVDIGRYRELPAWRKDFKHAWVKAKESPITLPLNERYRPDPVRWVCTCPQFVIDRFLICKHLVQAVHPVHPVFFLQVKRNRTLPFWSHPSLIPLSDNQTLAPSQASASVPSTTPESLPVNEQPASTENDREYDGVDGSDDELSELIDMSLDTRQGGRTYRENMKAHVDAIRDFCDGLEYQIQFEDQRFLDTLEREGARFLRLMENCLSRERRSNSTRPGSIAPATWEQSTANAMFYRTRPVVSERHT